VGDDGSVMSVSGAAGAAGATDDGGCASGSGVSTASVIHCTHATSHHGSDASMVALTVTKTADGISTTLTLAADGTTMLVDRDATQLAAGDVHLRLTVDGPDRCEEPVDHCENMEKKCHSTISTEPVVALTISKDTTSKDIKTTSKDIKTYADMVQGLHGEGKVVRCRQTSAIKVQQAM
jgi:NAD-specific glutamate dehydrogenase